MTKACRTPESWTDPMTSLQVSGPCVYVCVCVCDRLQDEKIQYAKLVIWVRVSSDGSEMSQPVRRASHHPRKKNYVYCFFCARIFFVAQVYMQVLYFHFSPLPASMVTTFPPFSFLMCHKVVLPPGGIEERATASLQQSDPPKTSRIESFTVRVACRCGCVMSVSAGLVCVQ